MADITSELTRRYDEQYSQWKPAARPSAGHISGPSGIDIVPARLTPGEFVMNAAAAQRFAPVGSVQQQGTPPVHVTANIVVNPPPGADPRAIARSVVDELARLKIRGRG